jgi:hypothetical protein
MVHVEESLQLPRDFEGLKFSADLGDFSDGDFRVRGIQS